jgi:hypothetical protein
VGAGWNLVGSIAYDVVASTISSVPPGIITSPWYGFESGYVPVGFVKPGKGHWVKISEAGTIVLSVSGAERPASDPLGMLAGLNSLTLADSRGGRQTLYFGDRQHTQLPANFFELPPIGPDGFFDARFESQRLVETFNEATGASAEFPISIRSVEYPLSVSWDIKPGSSTRFVLRYGVSDGIIVQRTVMSGLGQLSIANQSVNRLIVAVEADNIPQQFLLLQNYPNPFNPSTQITFALPVRANVVLKIYDVLGREIRTLASGSRAAGYYDVTWDGRNGDGSHVGSGVYFFRLVALGEAGTTVFQDTRKLMLLR